MRVLVYVICSALTALAGLLLLSRINAGLPKTGSGLEMEVVTAVVLGGVSIYGGKGSIFGVFVGVLIMGVLAHGMTYLNVSEYVQLVIRGFVLLIAIGFDNLSKHAELRQKRLSP
jgi:ribose transport system permease protein